LFILKRVKNELEGTAHRFLMTVGGVSLEVFP